MSSSEPSPRPASGTPPPRSGAPAPPPRPGQPAPEQPRRRFRIPWWWVGVVIAALVINQYAASRVTEPTTRIRVPYSPFFVQQVEDRNVKEITSKGTAIQGAFKQRRSTRARSRRRTSRRRSRRSRTRSSSRRCSEQRGHRQRGAARHGRAVLGEPARRLRPDAALPRACSSCSCAAPGARRTCSATSAARRQSATSPAARR